MGVDWGVLNVDLTSQELENEHRKFSGPALSIICIIKLKCCYRLNQKEIMTIVNW